jgi:hypothetical protein
MSGDMRFPSVYANCAERQPLPANSKLPTQRWVDADIVREGAALWGFFIKDPPICPFTWAFVKRGKNKQNFSKKGVDGAGAYP